MSRPRPRTVVANLVRWVKDVPMQNALARNQFSLVMALCVEDNTFPSFSPVWGECVTDSINVSDIVDFILWGACIEDMKTTRNLLQATCALLENYKDIALQVWPMATAGDTAYRAIMFTFRRRGMDIIGDKLKYSLAMSAVTSLCTDLLGPVSENTYPMFFNTSTGVFDVFATQVYLPHILPRQRLYHHTELCDIIGKGTARVSSIVSALHAKIWGSPHYIQPCLETLQFITTVSIALGPRHSFSLDDLYIAGMAMSGLLASHQMMSCAVPAGCLQEGYRHIADFLEDYANESETEDEQSRQALEENKKERGKKSVHGNKNEH